MKQTAYYYTGEIREEIFHDLKPRIKKDLPVVIKYYRNGVIKRQLWANEQGYPHRENGFADIRYNSSGKITSAYEWNNGKIIRD